MALRGAALPIMRQQVFSGHGGGTEAGQQPEVVEQQVVRALLDHQHDPARARPGTSLVLHLMKPQPRLGRWPPRRALEMRPGKTMESAVVAQRGDIGRALPPSIPAGGGSGSSRPAAWGAGT